MFLDINGVNYHVEVFGEGEPLLLFHGFTGSTKSWSELIQQWQYHCKVIAVDLLGHGLTDHPVDYHRYSAENAARDIVEILQQLHIDQAHVLGYSMGGRLALSFCCLYPDKVLSLILESSSPGLRTDEERETRALSDNLLAERIEREGMESFIAYWEKLPLFASQEKNLPLETRQRLRLERLKNNPQGLANSLRGMGTGVQPSWWDDLQSLSIPVLLLAGELDDKFKNINNEMSKLLPNANLVVVEEAGHTIHLEQTEIFDKIVMDYITKNV